VSALQVLACIQAAGKPASEVCRKFEPVPQILKNVRFDGQSPLVHEGVSKAIEAARERLGNHGRLVIRPSGTEPLIRVMAEGDDPSLVETLVDELCDTLRRAA
jgi:phosphoglucosamine mutase